MSIRHITASLIALLACGAISAAEGGAGDHPKKEHEKGAEEIVKSKATGTVTAVNAEKKSFTLKEDGTNAENEYRAYFREGKPEKMLEAIAKLKVGDRLHVVYTEREGRRALAIEAAKAAKDEGKN